MQESIIKVIALSYDTTNLKIIAMFALKKCI